VRTTAAPLVLTCLSVTVASAERLKEPQVEFQVGFNVRQFATTPGAMTAFRGQVSEPAVEAGIARTISLRFTRMFRHGFWLGGEAETGVLAEPGSNLAGAYGVAGVRGTIGTRVALAVELATGPRWVRYASELDDVAKLIAEPRVRAEVWVYPQWTLGTAIGSTLGGGDVWMAGIYVGLHSRPYGR
jgi:hypothetical protein